MSFVIAHVTDTHLSSARPYFTDNFAALAEHLKTARPDLVVNTGDAALNGGDERADLDAALAAHRAMGLDWLALPGNHDIGDNQETATKQPVNAERRQRWLDSFGQDFWRRHIPGWRLLGINSLLLGSDLAAAAGQEAFVAQAVRDLGGLRLALFLHKPLCLDAMSETEVSGASVNPEPRRRLLAALGDVRPALVCSGHLHEYRERDIDGMRHVWGPAVAFVVPEWFIANHGGERVIGYVRLELAADGAFTAALVRPDGLRAHDLGDFPQAYGDLQSLKRQIEAKKQ